MEKKAYRGRMWKMMEKEPCLRGMWEHFSCERSKAGRRRKEGSNTRSVAAGIACPRILGASEMLP